MGKRKPKEAVATNRERLLDLFLTVLGRSPVGRPIAAKKRIDCNQRLAVEGRDATRIPDILFDFHATFGGEHAVTRPFYHLYGPADLIVAGFTFIIFAFDPRGGFDFGMTRDMMAFDDPAVEIVPRRHRDDICAWQDHSNSLDDCLVEFAGRNLFEAMRCDLFVADATDASLLAELAAYQSIVLTKTGDQRVPCRLIYAPGTIILHDPVANELMIGLDSVPRALAFQDRHRWNYEEEIVDE